MNIKCFAGYPISIIRAKCVKYVKLVEVHTYEVKIKL